MMNADPRIKDRLERAAQHVRVDTEEHLARVLQSGRRVRRRHVALVALAAALAVIALAVFNRLPSDEGTFLAGPGFGRLAMGQRTGSGPNGLYDVDLTDGTRRPIAPGLGNVTAAAWSPDGRSIAFTVEKDGGARYALVVADADGTNLRTIVEHDKAEGTVGPDLVSVAWSPDGAQLAYSGRSPGRGRTVSILSADGSTTPRVLDGHWESVSWSSNGELLVRGWPDAGPEGRFDLYTLRPDGTGLRRLTDDDLAEQSASWSPDGSRIVFTRPDGSDANANIDVYVMDADGSNVHMLTDVASFDALPVWSPDGDWIAFTSDRDATTPVSARGEETSIYVMRADGTGVRLLLDGGGAVTFPLAWTR